MRYPTIAAKINKLPDGTTIPGNNARTSDMDNDSLTTFMPL